LINATLYNNNYIRRLHDMTQIGRPGLSAEKKSEVWFRWRRGESFSEIGRAVGRAPGSIYGVLQLHGGISPRKRKRSRLALSLSEREEISRGIASNESIRQIARSLNRSPSTVCRELKRHGGPKRYRAVNADEKAWDQTRRPKLCKFAQKPRLRKLVSEKLALQWSPEQISGWLRRKYSLDSSMQVSHETIYRSLFIQARGVLKKELINHLRSGRKMRQSKQFNTKGVTRGQIIDGISIRERPKEIEDRSVPGHWEGDLIAGSHNTHIATLVERQSRFTMLVKVIGKDTMSVTKALSEQIQSLPVILRKTITWDRGMELAYHKKFTMATNVKVYFCDPRSPWQRGTNENTNGLLRQYFPKKTDLSIYSQADLNKIALRLNQRPRKMLGYSTPADVFGNSVALTS
jgi:IS30 family transposase